MLNLQKIKGYLEGCPKGPWVQGGLDEHMVPLLRGKIITADLSDPDLLRLWGDYRERRGWVASEWREYLREDHYTQFREFGEWLWRRFGI